MKRLLLAIGLIAVLGTIAYADVPKPPSSPVTTQTNSESTLNTTKVITVNATTAQSPVTTAQSTASTAQSTASTAQSTASTAQSTASTAQSTASTAQSTASTAHSPANTTQSAANTTQSAASTAQSTATTAQSTATTAQSTATTAQSTATTVQPTITSAQTNISTVTGITTEPTTPTAETNTTGATTTAPVTSNHSTTIPMPDTDATVNTYTVLDQNQTCLMAKMRVHFKQLVNNTVTNVTKSATLDQSSNCSEMVVDFGDGDHFKLTFENDSSSYYVSKIEVQLKQVMAQAVNLTIGKVALKNSYLCDDGFSQTLSNNVSFVATDIQFQAIEFSGGNFGHAENCQKKKDLSPIIPIVVGCVLAALVLLVIVAYFIGRRRVRAGYEEI